MRLLLLIFLVGVLPMAVYLAANGGFDKPEPALSEFVEQLKAIRGDAPEQPADEDVLERPEPSDGAPAPGTTKPKPEPGKPAVKEEPKPPLADAVTLFGEGKFAVAADATHDKRLRALAELGAVLAAAFPPPPEPYLVVEMNGGAQQEGFAENGVGETRLLHPTGRAIGLPDAMIVGKRELTGADVEKRTLPAIEKEAQRGDADGLLRAAAAAFRIGRPDLAAPLLERIVKADTGGVLKAVRRDLPASSHEEFLRAYSDASVAMQAPVSSPTTVKVKPDDEPERTSPLKTKPSPSRNSRLEVKDEKARQLMSDARPLREAGRKLYDKIYANGLDKADPNDVDEAIRKYKAALDLYEKAFEIEDNDAIYALLTGCSKKLFQLRFWKEQVGDR